jgi:hypothetical protein
MAPRLRLKERRIREELEDVSGFPHWRYQAGGSTAYKNFKLYTRPGVWEQEVIKRAYWWTVGDPPNVKFFTFLEDALFYVERLQNLPIRIIKPGRGVTQPRHAPIVTRNAAVEEEARRNGIMLDF